MAVTRIIANLHAPTEGGSGTDLRAFSVGVDDLDATLAAVRVVGAEVSCGPATDPRGLTRFHFRHSAGNLANVADH